MAAVRVSQHLARNNLREVRKCAYRPHHSTETALVDVQQKLAVCFSGRKAALVVLLDLTAAFVTVDIECLPNTIREQLGVTCLALAWFELYLSGRSFRAFISGHSSELAKSLDRSFPQGLVLGLFLFTVYTMPLSSQIVISYPIDYHKFADAQQLITFFDPTVVGDLDMQLGRLKRLHSSDLQLDVHHDANVLKTRKRRVLGSDKSTSFGSLRAFYSDSRHPDHSTIRLYRESWLCLWQTHGNGCFRQGHLWQVQFSFEQDWQHSSLSLYGGLSLCCGVSIALSTPGCCTALRAGQPVHRISRLQKLQNWAARLVSLVPKHSLITPVLKELHWLPVRHRIAFKLMVHMYKGLNGHFSYLS